MNESEKDPELERYLEKIQLKTPPEGIIKDYAAGVQSKIETRKRFRAFTIPVSVAVVSISAALISWALWGHPAHGTNLRPALAVKTAASQLASKIAVAEEMKILQALGVDSTEVLVNAMNTEQLAKEMAYWDEVAVHSYKQIATPANR